MTNFKIYLKSILIPVIVGGVVGIIISGQIDYNNLQKPPFSPPSILFPIVWTILYILMGVSYGILKVRKLNDEEINFIYYLQILHIYSLHILTLITNTKFKGEIFMAVISLA